MKSTRFRRAWRDPHWVRPVLGLSAALFAFSSMFSTALNFAYNNDRREAFAVQQREVEALRNELTCVRRESSAATRIEGEITREGWRAMLIWASTGSPSDPRIVEAAQEVNDLYMQLGPAIEERTASTATCDIFQG